jgi:hypothetical protein
MKGALIFALILPALGAADCSTKVITETKTAYITCTAGGQNCGQSGVQPTPSSVIPAPSNIPSAPVAPAPQPPVVAPPPSVQPSKNGAPSPSPSSDKGGGAPAATYNPLPDAAIFSSTVPSNFMPLQGQDNKAVILNSCDYDLYLNSVGCHIEIKNVLIAAGETYTEAIRDCTDAGVAMKVTSKNHTKPVMIEYGADKEKKRLFYDLSFLDCMIKDTTDLSGCAGWTEGHQCSGGNGSTVFACQPNEYCDQTSYTVPEYGQTEANSAERIKVPVPVASWNLSGGVVWEICAANRKQ